MKKIAIIGGLGYVGLKLVEYLRGEDMFITVFARKNLKVLIDERENLEIRSIESINKTDKFDVVINLAYPTSYSRKNNFKTNKNLVGTIKNLSNPGTIIIHTSTLAVFGTNLDNPVLKQPIPFRRDVSYTEVKIHIENLLIKSLSTNPLHIIRLGNVSGAGSSSWLHGIADRILFRQAFPDASITAPSNLTYVLNICDFIKHLIKKDISKQVLSIHHFAEFSSQKWSLLFESIGHSLNEAPIYKPFDIRFPGSLLQELGLLLKPVLPSSVFYRMLSLRVMSSFARKLVDIIPARNRLKLKVFPSEAILSHDTKDIVFASQVQFQHDISSDWIPKYSFEEYLSDIKESLKTAGYIIYNDGDIIQ